MAATPFPRRQRLVVATLSVFGLIVILMVVGRGTGLDRARATESTPQSAWTSVFRDDFSGAAGSAIDNNWLSDVGTSYPGGAGQWGTGEIETATDSTANVHQDGAGHLLITPIRDADGRWTSGRVETQRTDFTAPVGGQLEMTASIEQPNPTSGVGYWPAFWALGAAARGNGATGWPSIGELDVMEDVNALSQVSHTFHCGVWGQPPCNEPDGISSGLAACSGCQTAFHTYSVILDRSNASDEQLRFYTDGTQQFVVNQDQVGPGIWASAVHHGFFMILDVAVGGSYPNKVCGCDSTAVTPSSGAAMSVDYVAVSQTLPMNTAPTTVPTTTVPTAVPTTTAPVGPGSVIQAEAYAAHSGTRVQSTTDAGAGADVGWIGNGNWLAYPKVDFGVTPAAQFVARVASGAADGTSGAVEVHLDSLSAPCIARFDVADTGSWQSWRTVAANLQPTHGVHTVYLRFVSGSASNFVNVNWFTFTG